MSGAISPENASRMSNSVPPSFGVSRYVRTPLNRPSGIPPVHTIRWGGSNALTRTGNARPGLSVVYTRSFPPGAMAPSTFSIVGFQVVHWAPSIRTAQTASGGAPMSVVTANDFMVLPKGSLSVAREGRTNESFAPHGEAPPVVCVHQIRVGRAPVSAG